MKRSKWKGPFVYKTNSIKSFLLLLPRNYEVTLSVVGLFCLIHTGKDIVKVKITNQMIGYKIGFFVTTRKKPQFNESKR